MMEPSNEEGDAMSNPVVELHKAWNGAGKKARKEIDLGMFEQKMRAWVSHLTTLPTCVDFYSQESSNCQCC
jgi:hypothetical protein